MHCLETWNNKYISRDLVDMSIDVELCWALASVLWNARQWIVKAEGFKLMHQLTSVLRGQSARIHTSTARQRFNLGKVAL